MKENTMLNRRITVIDALRGFALLGVLLVHMSQHYSYASADPFTTHEPFLAGWNEGANWFVRKMLSGKFINIFAFLFGMSFFIQMDRAAQKGIRFEGRFLWRMVVLFVIGIVGNCFYSQDILSIYAFFGVILLFLNRFKNWILIMIAVLLLAGGPQYVMMGYNELTGTPVQEISFVDADAGSPRNVETTYIESLEHTMTRANAWKLNFQFVKRSRGYVTLAIFILGLVVGRTRFFENVHLKKRRNWILLGGFTLLLCLCNYLIDLFPPQENIWKVMQEGKIPALSAMALQTLSDLKLMLASSVITMAFIVLYQMKGIGNVLDWLAPYGRMGLTNYVCQNIIGACLFAVWACGSTFSYWQPAESLLLGLIIYSVQVVICKVWLNKFQYGPLEWLWRSLTYFKAQPFLKK